MRYILNLISLQKPFAVQLSTTGAHVELSIPVILNGDIAICTATNPYSTVNISANITIISEWGDSLLSINGIIIIIVTEKFYA